MYRATVTRRFVGGNGLWLLSLGLVALGLLLLATTRPIGQPAMAGVNGNDCDAYDACPEGQKCCCGACIPEAACCCYDCTMIDPCYD